MVVYKLYCWDKERPISKILPSTLEIFLDQDCLTANEVRIINYNPIEFFCRENLKELYECFSGLKLVSL